MGQTSTIDEVECVLGAATSRAASPARVQVAVALVSGSNVEVTNIVEAVICKALIAIPCVECSIVWAVAYPTVAARCAACLRFACTVQTRFQMSLSIQCTEHFP